MNWCGPLLLGMAREGQGLQSFTQESGLVPHVPWVIPWRTKPAAVWDSPGCQVLPSPRRESPGPGRGWSPAPSGTGTSCPGSHSARPGGNPWRLLRPLPVPKLPHPSSWGLLTHSRQTPKPGSPSSAPRAAASHCLSHCPFLQSFCSGAVSSLLRKRWQKWDRSWPLSVGGIYPS